VQVGLSVDWSHVLTASIALVIGIVLKTLLDLKLAVFVVKHFSWVPTRWLFRHREHHLAGQWEHVWDSGGSEAFEDVRHRHGHPLMKQFGSYCYAEFFARGKLYYFFGRISGEHFVGEWADARDRLGYFGAFQLRIIDSDKMEGLWIGHSKTNGEIRSDKSVWTRIKV